MPNGPTHIRKKQTGTSLNYQLIGSGGGVKQITAKTVDFGASDPTSGKLMKRETRENSGQIARGSIDGQ